MKLVHPIAVSILLVLYLSLSYTQVDKTLRFKKDGTFRIVQFTDLHFGESEEKDINSSIVQDTILGLENPDLVILTGDSVSGYSWDNSAGWYAKIWARVISSMVKHNIRWANALGNHDSEADLSKREIIAQEMTNPLSLTQLGPSGIQGASNYYLPVLESDAQSNTAAAVLYLFDSGHEDCLGVKGWDCVYPDQIEWYRNLSQYLQSHYGKKVPATAAFHIPFPEFMNVWNVDTCYGRRDEDVCCFSVNTGLYAAMKEMGDVNYVICGHDHNNDYYGSYYGITLAYGRKTGYGGYGPPDGWLRGARVLEYTEKPFSVKMWIRQQDGTKVTIQPTHSPGTNQQHICCGANGQRKL